MRFISIYILQINFISNKYETSNVLIISDHYKTLNILIISGLCKTSNILIMFYYRFSYQDKFE